ncbi:hypothetical protein pclt_cds_754 [Pandoravirus celtis]|uniref:Uncharacterized protein n=1 Tax=Pandoravirus celtis TaxID=2568002 RepID=A0A4D6EHQ1_9VIRU|nr:hypothetical protein pclt_cds_754 [Pandoravirus celtis]
MGGLGKARAVLCVATPFGGRALCPIATTPARHLEIPTDARLPLRVYRRLLRRGVDMRPVFSTDPPLLDMVLASCRARPWVLAVMHCWRAHIPTCLPACACRGRRRRSRPFKRINACASLSSFGGSRPTTDTLTRGISCVPWPNPWAWSLIARRPSTHAAKDASTGHARPRAHNRHPCRRTHP